MEYDPTKTFCYFIYMGNTFTFNYCSYKNKEDFYNDYFTLSFRSKKITKQMSELLDNIIINKTPVKLIFCKKGKTPYEIIIIITSSKFSIVKKGPIIECISANSELYKKLDAKNINHKYHLNTYGEKYRYHFNVKHPGEIDWEKISEDLSYEHPIILIDSGVENHIMISKELLEMAKTKNIMIVFNETRRIIQNEVFDIIKPPLIKNDINLTMKYFIDWAKKVRRAKWLDKRTVSVKIPKI